jgi:acyl-CoA synthetase (AMP-forming)/AMP-acid ligase II
LVFSRIAATQLAQKEYFCPKYKANHSELTLPVLLRRAASEFPLLGISYVQENCSVLFQSYPELLMEANSVSIGLFSLGMKSGDKAIIATENNRETITLLWGCFLAGIVPTILQSAASFTDHNPSATKLINVFKQLGSPYIFTSKSAISNLLEFEGRVIAYSAIPRLEGELFFEPELDDLAFIQFSSGSTGEPKGIMLTHRNIALNIEGIIEGIELKPTDNGGNWMPLYHDMGLIGYHLTPIMAPCNQFHIHTIDFIKNPALWLEMMSRYKITVSGCPNFGQELIIRYMKRRPDGHFWDLSSVKAILNGAEPISVKVLNDFNRVLKSYGFHEEAMMAVYGMAEATLAVSFSPLMEHSVVTSFDNEKLDKDFVAVKVGITRSGKHIRSIVSVGKPVKHVLIKIVDSEGNTVDDCKIGHVLVMGNSVTRGYYLNPQQTEKLFAGEWLRTGDMGFIFEGNLYISGRYKDIIFVNGKNYFANDLEVLACNLEEFNFGKIIIGGITDYKTGKEKVLVFAAAIPEAKAQEVLEKLRTLMRKDLGIPVDELIIIKSNEIPKTSSGKIQRYKVIQSYQQGGFLNSVFR